MESPILITGAARSGTSLVAGIVNHCGAFGGQMSGPNHNNRKGMFENSAIRNHIVKPFLGTIGADKMCQKPLPDRNILRKKVCEYGFAGKWQAEVEGVIESQGYESGPWFYKGAKMCLMWPIWHAAFPSARWVIVRRNDDGILLSCLRTPFMRAYRDSEGWSGWLEEHKTCFGEMLDAGLNLRTLWSDDIVTGRFSRAKVVIDWLGLKWNEEAVKAFVDPSLYHTTERVR